MFIQVYPDGQSLMDSQIAVEIPLARRIVSQGAAGVAQKIFRRDALSPGDHIQRGCALQAEDLNQCTRVRPHHAGVPTVVGLRWSPA